MTYKLAHLLSYLRQIRSFTDDKVIPGEIKQFGLEDQSLGFIPDSRCRVCPVNHYSIRPLWEKNGTSLTKVEWL